MIIIVILECRMASDFGLNRSKLDCAMVSVMLPMSTTYWGSSICGGNGKRGCERVIADIEPSTGGTWYSIQN